MCEGQLREEEKMGGDLPGGVLGGLDGVSQGGRGDNGGAVGL